MRYLKLFENFESSKTREELIENLISTSTFEREELESMTDSQRTNLTGYQYAYLHHYMSKGYQKQIT